MIKIKKIKTISDNKITMIKFEVGGRG